MRSEPQRSATRPTKAAPLRQLARNLAHLGPPPPVTPLSPERFASARAAAAASVSALNRAARKVTTRCGAGVMVWRLWGSGEPLVLLHGGYGSWTHWIRAIPELSRHYELWVPDLPGLGASALPPEPWTPASSAAAIVAGL